MNIAPATPSFDRSRGQRRLSLYRPRASLCSSRRLVFVRLKKRRTRVDSSITSGHGGTPGQVTTDALGYEHLADEQAKHDTPRDLSAAWAKCEPLLTSSAATRERIERFCRMKQITVEALAALETRVRYVGQGPDLLLACPAYHRIDGVRCVSGVKYRHVETGRRHAEAYTTFGIPQV